MELLHHHQGCTVTTLNHVCFLPCRGSASTGRRGTTGVRLDPAFLASQCRAYIRLSRAASHSPALGSLSLLGRSLSAHPLSWWELARSLWFGALRPRCTAFSVPISCSA